MKLGDHPELYAAITKALGGLSWAFGACVWASDAPRGYKLTVSTGDRFLVHSRTIVVPVSMEKDRNLDHRVWSLVEEMRLELGRVTG